MISFTVETDGRLPSGQALRDAVAEVDAATDAAPAYYMVNCAHPTHFEDVLSEGGLERVRGLRANASTRSHAELDEADELDQGDPDDLAARYRELRPLLPGPQRRRRLLRHRRAPHREDLRGFQLPLASATRR